MRRALGASNSWRISWVDGLQQSSVNVEHSLICLGTTSAASGDCYIGVDLDSTTATPQVVAQGTDNNNATANFLFNIQVSDTFAPQLGFHFAQAVQAANGQTMNFYVNVASPVARNLGWLRADLEMHLPLILPLAVFRRRRKAANDNQERQDAAA